MHIQSNNLDSIPIDLLNEIFSRLPTKSVGRCRCVSKILASRLADEYLKRLCLTRSSTRPSSFLFFLRLKNHKWAFFSSPQPQYPCENPYFVVTADFHAKFPSLSRDEFVYASGLFYYPCVEISTNKDEDAERVICNPITGQYVILPKLRTKAKPISIFGFDPIENQFKVLLLNARINNTWVDLILTLGDGEMRWRTIQCPLVLYPYPFTYYSGHESICINGVVYFLAQHGACSVIVCFNVRSETFKLIDIEYMTPRNLLINHKGKLVMAQFNYYELHMWVLEDVEKHEWSKYVYTLPERIRVLRKLVVYVVGMTSTGEIVLSTLYSDSSSMFVPSYVFYFNPERNSLQTVTVQGFENHPHGKVYVFMDHVEDLNVYQDRKELKPNAYIHLREGRPTFENIWSSGSF